MTSHFDKIAARYDREIPEHIRLHLLMKKTDLMISVLDKSLPSGAVGVDLGCGTGHYLRRISEMGYAMTGLEYSAGMAEQALATTRDLQVKIGIGSITAAPFADASFDFAYAINVLHHLPSQEDQLTALGDVARILKPGGLFLLQDFNCDSLVTRFYMNYVFPLTSRIDDDETEVWISPKWLRGNPVRSLRFCALNCFTFMPNFTPRWLFGAMRQLERGLEVLTRGRAGAHFLAVMRKE